jgi:predicted DNA-binding transcriptional regulator AlpA
MPDNAAPITDRRLLTVRETCRLLSVSPPTFWRRAAQFDLVKVGRRTLVRAESVDRFIDNLPKARCASVAA